MEEQPHHIQQELCANRAMYRQGRKLTAIKVYTVASESKHLLIFGVPDLKLRTELKSALSKFGRVKKLVEVADYPNNEAFTKAYHVLYEEIRNSRFAKRKLDATSFYGGVLHICYAPELETVEEVKEKLEARKKDIFKRLNLNFKSYPKKYRKTDEKRNVSSSSNAGQQIPVYGPQIPSADEAKITLDEEIKVLAEETRVPEKKRPRCQNFIPRQVWLPTSGKAPAKRKFPQTSTIIKKIVFNKPPLQINEQDL